MDTGLEEMEMEDLIKKIMSTYTKVVDRECYVAGGAPLSIKFGKKVNDIDLFVENNNIENAESVERFFKFLSEISATNLKLSPTEEYSKYSDMTGLKSLHEFKVDGVKVQLIEVSQFSCDLFDIDLCKIYYKSNIWYLSEEDKIKLKETEEHLNDVLNKTLTVDYSNLTDSQFKKTINKRIPKYIERFGYSPQLLFPEAEYPLVLKTKV